MNTQIIKIILISLIISISISFYYINKFDRYEFSSETNQNHAMVKSDPAKFWVRAHNIKQQLNSGINYFKTGEEYRIPYLPSKILYLFSIITNLKFYDENLDLIIDSNSQTIDKIKIGKNKVSFLIFQTILYYLSIIFLYTKIKKKNKL